MPLGPWVPVASTCQREQSLGAAGAPGGCSVFGLCCLMSCPLVHSEAVSRSVSSRACCVTWGKQRRGGLGLFWKI